MTDKPKRWRNRWVFVPQGGIIGPSHRKTKWGLIHQNHQRSAARTD